MVNGYSLVLKGSDRPVFDDSQQWLFPLINTELGGTHTSLSLRWENRKLNYQQIFIYKHPPKQLTKVLFTDFMNSKDI